MHINTNRLANHSVVNHHEPKKQETTLTPLIDSFKEDLDKALKSLPSGHGINTDLVFKKIVEEIESGSSENITEITLDLSLAITNDSLSLLETINGLLKTYFPEKKVLINL